MNEKPLNEKPLRSENYLKSEEFLRVMTDSKLRELSTAPFPDDLGLVIEEYEDRIDYVYIIRHPHFTDDDPGKQRYVLSSDSKEDIRKKTAGQRIKDMKNRMRLIKEIERYSL